MIDLQREKALVRAYHDALGAAVPTTCFTNRRIRRAAQRALDGGYRFHGHLCRDDTFHRYVSLA